MDFKKMLEYNSPKNVHKRLMGLNNIQKVIVLCLIPCIPIFLMEVLVLIFGGGFMGQEFLLITPMLVFALYLFQSKK